MDQTWPNRQFGGAPQNAIPIRVRQGNGPSLERRNMNGDDLQFGRRRNRTRSNHSESQGSGAEEERLGSSYEAAGSYGQSPGSGWYNRSTYEQAEANYQRRLANTVAMSSSPKSPSTKGSYNRSMTFQRSKQPNGDQENPVHVTVAKSPGTQRRQGYRGRNRTTSETEGGKGSRGPYRRKRGHSETEFIVRPKWDNNNMSGVQCFATETIWFDKTRYDDAERRFYEGANGPQGKTAQQASKARPKRQHRNSSSHAGGDPELVSRMKSLELENHSLHKVVEEMRACLQKLEARVGMLEKSPATSAKIPCAKAAPVQQVKVTNGDDDDFDLFGSDEEEDAEAERLKQQRVDAYTARKANKPVLIAKSSILLDVKPWDDETDMAELEKCVRSVQADGLLWGASKLVPVGYGIKKLQIGCVVEDDKVGTDLLEEEITKFEDFVQSVDVAAFNKI